MRAVADGREALKAVQEEEFHLALLDLGLPGFSGLELLSRIKAQAPHTEVILFTGQAGMDSALQALRLGAYDYLLKSEMRLDNLQAVVARALERRRLDLSNRELLANLRRAQQELQPKGPGPQPGPPPGRGPGRAPHLGTALSRVLSISSGKASPSRSWVWSSGGPEENSLWKPFAASRG